MSATIPESMLLSDLLKSTGYDCPQDLQGKTFDQSTSGGGSEVVLEDNKEVSITENGTVEITPSLGKDGMKKVTANVNVPSGGGSATAYAWVWTWDSGSGTTYLNVDKAPEPATVGDLKTLISDLDTGDISITEPEFTHGVYARVSDTQFTITYTGTEGSSTYTYTRDSSKDFTLWG